MRSLRMLVLAATTGAAIAVVGWLSLLSAAPPTDGFSVHEWGTFTAVSGSDGVLLPGLEVAEEDLPPFVYSHAGMGNPGGKGLLRELRDVTVRMETPVLYFYSDEPRRVRVDVGFEGGSISQWYPQRSDGEEPAPPELRPDGSHVAPSLDFGVPGGYQGSIRWEVDVLGTDAVEPADLFHGSETLAWEYPRQVASNPVRNDQGETEQYLFYRGLGKVDLPLRVLADETKVYVENLGSEPIPFILLFDQGRPAVPSFTGDLGAATRVDGFLFERRARFHVVEGLGPGQSRALAFNEVRSPDWKSEVYKRMRDALADAGLYRDEADAMVRTWWHSYFEREGTRVFWVVPREHVDAILPIDIEPRPAELERVLVGRTEILTPRFERQLRGELRGSGHPWHGDRFERAYRARVQDMTAAGR